MMHFFQWSSARLVACLGLLALFATCKKEIPSDQKSSSSINYITTGPTDKVYNVSRTPDGGFLYCGYTSKDQGNKDGFMLKLDAHGKKEWYKTYGGDNSDEFYHAIQCSDGGFLAVGTTNSIGQGVKDGDYKLYEYAVKTNTNGDMEWEKSYTITTGVDAKFYHVVESPDHFFYATGRGYRGYWNVILAKFDLQGNLVYQKQYEDFSSYPPYIVGKTSEEFGTHISISKNGDIIVAGLMDHSNLSAYGGEYITFMMSVKPSGAMNFFYPYYDNQRTYKFTVQRRPGVYSENINDGHLIASTFDHENGKIYIQLLKTDLSGKIIWEKKYTGFGSAYVSDMMLLADGSILLTGSSSTNSFDPEFPEYFSYSKTMLMKLDKDGNILSSNYVGSGDNADMAKCIQELPNGGWLVAGSTALNSLGYDKMFVMTLDANGELLKN